MVKSSCNATALVTKNGLFLLYKKRIINKTSEVFNPCSIAGCYVVCFRVFNIRLVIAHWYLLSILDFLDEPALA